MEGDFEDQRLFNRVNVRFPARLKRKNVAEDVDVIIENISPVGAKVLVAHEVSPFDRLSISFTPSNGPPVAVNGYVAWIDKGNSGSWYIGVKFDEVDLLEANRIMEFCRQSFS